MKLSLRPGRRSLVLTLAAVAAVVVAACGQASTPATKTVTLTVWVPPVFTDAQKQLNKDFEKATGNTLDVQTFPVPFEQNILAKWSAGERPDIMYWHAIGNWLVQLIPDKNLRNLSGEAFVGKTVAGILNRSCTYKGKVYCSVINYPFIDGVFYNKPLFAQLGLTPPTNYTEFVQVAKQLKAAGKIPIYVGGGDQWPLQVLPFILWNDAIKQTKSGIIDQLNKNEVKFTDSRFVFGIQAEKDLHDQGLYNKDILTGTYENEQKHLMAGDTGMVVQGTWIIGSLVDAFGLDKVNATVGFFPLSKDSNVVSWQTVGAGAVYLPKTGDKDKEAAALDYIRFVTGSDYQKYLNDSKQYPILKGYAPPPNIPTPLVEANTALLKDSVPQYQQTLLAAYGPFETFLQEMIAGKKTAEDVAKTLDQNFEKSARDQGLPGF